MAGEMEKRPDGGQQASKRFRVQGGVVVVHNHWIHYKDLLFRELEARLDGLRVILTARSSTMRLGAPDLGVLPYSCEALSPESYERANKLRCGAALFVRLCALQPRVVIVSGWYDAVSWTALGWAQLWRRPAILWAESNDFDHRRWWWLEAPKKVYVRGFAQGHVYGTSSASYLIKLGMDARKILTKRAVVDTEHFRRMVLWRGEGGKRVFLFVGRLSEEKNLGRLIRAFGIASRERQGETLELRIAGYGPMRTELAELATNLGLDGCVKFLGPIPQERLPEVYSRADVFVLPSISETWGLVVNEAMCCELPAVVSSRCGCAEDLVNEETGWVVDPFDEQSMVEGILKAARMPRARLREMGRVARRLSEQYGPANCAKVVVEGLRCVLGE